MSCFSPNAIVFVDGTSSRFAGKLTQSLIDAYADSPAQLVPVPCGKCSGCRLDRSKAWADRMLLEFATDRDGVSKRALFLTLTYDNAHVPGILCTDGQYRYNLEPRDFQLFLKRLRKFFAPLRIRFYLGGEYGDQTFRPHGHMIVYGLGLDSFPDAFLWSTSGEDGNPLFESPTLDKIWQNGAVRFTEANYQTFCYVARYVIKKQFMSDDGSLFYKGRTPPFSRMSRKPGLGADYFSPDDVNSRVFLSDGVDVHSIQTPRIVLEKLRLTNPELFDNIKSVRRLIADSRQSLIIQDSDLTFLEQIRLNQIAFDTKMKVLHKRDKV